MSARAKGHFFTENHDSKNFKLVMARPPLSGGDIWIKVVLHQRYTTPVDNCDIWHDLRLFLKF